MDANLSCDLCLHNKDCGKSRLGPHKNCFMRHNPTILDKIQKMGYRESAAFFREWEDLTKSGLSMAVDENGQAIDIESWLYLPAEFLERKKRDGN